MTGKVRSLLNGETPETFVFSFRRSVEMKKSLRLFAVLAVLCSPSVALAQTEPWQQGAFEIRVFDVEQGDSQLIIFPSGFTILIDVWEPSWNSHTGASRVSPENP